MSVVCETALGLTSLFWSYLRACSSKPQVLVSFLVGQRGSQKNGVAGEGSPRCAVA